MSPGICSGTCISQAQHCIMLAINRPGQPCNASEHSYVKGVAVHVGLPGMARAEETEPWPHPNHCRKYREAYSSLATHISQHEERRSRLISFPSLAGIGTLPSWAKRELSQAAFWCFRGDALCDVRNRCTAQAPESPSTLRWNLTCW